MEDAYPGTVVEVAHQQELAQAFQRFDDSSTPRVTGPQLMEVLNSVDLDLEAAEVEQLGELLAPPPAELGTAGRVAARAGCYSYLRILVPGS
eukprot:COSAG06_NODE_4469_length_4222_cov_4.226534_1_plen_92_part_00